MASSRARICWALVSFVVGILLVGLEVVVEELGVCVSVVASHVLELMFRFVFFGQSRAM